jgi:hypothetical protein
MASHSKGRTVPHRRRSHSWLWLGVIAIIVLGGATLAFTALGGARSAALIPERTTYDFGTVSMRDGPITTTFPLTVQEPTVVTDVNSS